MIVSSLVKERAGIDICAITIAHSNIADVLLGIHGIFSGADSVTSLHGVGKATVLKIAKNGILSVSNVGDVKANMKSVQAQASTFKCVAYGKVTESMTKCREEWGIIPSTNQ